MKRIYFEPREEFLYNGIQTWSTWYLLSDGTVIQDGGNSQGDEWCRRYPTLIDGLNVKDISSYGEEIPDDPEYFKRRIV
jgi:hypothetical protein